MAAAPTLAKPSASQHHNAWWMQHAALTAATKSSANKLRNQDLWGFVVDPRYTL